MNKLKNVLKRILTLFLTAALLSGSLQGAVYAEEAKELQEISEVIEVEQKSVFNLPVLEFELECSELVYAYDEASNKREDTVLLKLEEITLSDSLENVRYIIKDSEEQIKQEDFLGEEKEIELNIEDFPKGIYTIQLLSNYNDEVESQTISSEAISFSTDYEKREYPVNKEINWSGRLDADLEVTFEDIFPEVENTLLENISDRIMADEGETESTGSISIYDAQGNPVEMSNIVAEGEYQILAGGVMKLLGVIEMKRPDNLMQISVKNLHVYGTEGDEFKLTINGVNDVTHLSSGSLYLDSQANVCVNVLNDSNAQGVTVGNDRAFCFSVRNTSNIDEVTEFEFVLSDGNETWRYTTQCTLEPGKAYLLPSLTQRDADENYLWTE